MMMVVNHQTKRVYLYFQQACVMPIVTALVALTGMSSAQAMDNLHPTAAKLRQRYLQAKSNADFSVAHGTLHKRVITTLNAEAQDETTSTFAVMANHEHIAGGFAPLVLRAVNTMLENKGEEVVSWTRQEIHNAAGQHLGKEVNDEILGNHALCVDGLSNRVSSNQATPLLDMGRISDRHDGYWGSVTFGEVIYGLHTPSVESEYAQGRPQGARWFSENGADRLSLNAWHIQKILQRIPQEEVDALFLSYSETLNEGDRRATEAAQQQKEQAATLDGLFESLGGDGSGNK